MTHIDPFAPGDSPQHPANWGRAPQVEDAIADTYQWRRDHFVMTSEADADIPADELQERHERYAEYLDEYGTGDEQSPGGEFVPMSTLLRRAVLVDLDEQQVDEWRQLFEEHSTADERDEQWVEDVLPDLDELRARARVAEKSAEAQAPTAAAEVTQTGTPVPEVLLTAPKGNALKEDWVDYALAVENARGGTLTREQAEAMTVSDLKTAYKPKAD